MNDPLNFTTTEQDWAGFADYCDDLDAERIFIAHKKSLARGVTITDAPPAYYEQAAQIPPANARYIAKLAKPRASWQMRFLVITLLSLGAWALVSLVVWGAVTFGQWAGAR